MWCSGVTRGYSPILPPSQFNSVLLASGHKEQSSTYPGVFPGPWQQQVSPDSLFVLGLHTSYSKHSILPFPLLDKALPNPDRVPKLSQTAANRSSPCIIKAMSFSSGPLRGFFGLSKNSMALPELKVLHYRCRHKVSKCCWNNGTDRLALHRVTTNFQSVKNTISAKCNKVKSNKTRYACT